MPEVRPIDANAAADKIMRDTETHADEIGIGAVAIMIAFARALRDETDFPTIEAEPVRHERWIFAGEETMHDGWTYRKYKCTACGFSTVEAKNFCPDCGARMDGGADDAGRK